MHPYAMCSNAPGKDETNSPAATPRQKERKRHFRNFDKRFSAPCFSTVEITICSQLNVITKEMLSVRFVKTIHLQCRASTGPEELHHQFRTAPEREGLLISPVQRLGEQFQVEVPQELSKQETHLGVRKAVDEMLANAARYSSANIG